MKPVLDGRRCVNSRAPGVRVQGVQTLENRS
jgi:hypothetical protein